MLAICNDQAFLSEMLTRKRSPVLPRALPGNLAEWTYVDRTAPVWGVSHYATPGFGSAVTGGEGNAPDATGVAVEFADSPHAARARMLSTEDPWAELLTAPDWHGAAKSRKVHEGVWELSVAADPEAAPVAVLELMGTLGFLTLI
jgi:hypothetical protein